MPLHPRWTSADRHQTTSFVYMFCARANTTATTNLVVVVVARGDHTPLRFVTTCNNGVFNGGDIYAPLNIFSCLICRYKATLTCFLASYFF